MVFSSVFFIFVFLPTFFAFYYAVPAKARSYVILIGSYIFYSWWRVDFVGLMFFSTSMNFLFGKFVHEAKEERTRKVILFAAISANLGLLFYFKYFNFMADSLAYAVNDGQTFDWAMEKIILPIGISFYNFQAMSYIIDIYRKEIEPSRSFIDFCAYKALFPQLIAGPVLRFSDLAGQFYERTHTLDKFNYGAMRFFTGLAKKVIIADSVAVIADAMFSIKNPTFVESWLGAIAYTIQLYFDFSGYSAMAIGLGMMMGFRFVENFDAPYASSNITEFWRRWHISLSTWLRDYLYISLGGNRKGPSRTYLNLLATMLLGGMWHGANWTFLLWGVWHGALLAVERFLKIGPKSPFRYSTWMITLLLIVIGWVPFRAENLTVAFDMLSGMAGLNGFGLRSDYAWQIKWFGLLMMTLGIMVALTEPWLRNRFRMQTTTDIAAVEVAADRPAVSLAMALIAPLLGAIAIVKLVADSDTPFLYFQF